MSDKEPRRRKKRKDLQPPRKEDVHTTDDQFLIPSKSEAKDSDQELEEEITIPTHQPSVFAKFVFVLLFSGLVVSLSFIFISLHGTDRGDVDIFNGHSEEIEVSHGEHDFHEHDNDIHDHEHDHDNHDQDHDHDIHDQDHDIHNHDEETSEEVSFQANIADYFPSIGSILSFKDEHTKEIVEESISDIVGERELPDEQPSEPPVPISTDEYVSSSNQESIKEAAEDTEQSMETPVSSEIYPDVSEEPESVSFRSDVALDEALFQQNAEISPEPEAEVDEQDDEEILENEAEYSYSYTYATKTEAPESVTESYTTTVTEDISPITPTIEEQLFDQDYPDSDNFINAPAENIMEDVTYYEKESITNEDDFKIRDQLDDLDEILQKELSVDDNDDDHDEDDDEYDDDDELEQGAGDEFDFWQF